jgi:hypothetical protein
MESYLVHYSYREDDGLIYSMPTHFDSLEVEAADAGDARLKAIDAAYERHKPACSHVRVRGCRQLESPTEGQERCRDE